ncbi:hypothetical protein ROI_23960 [Roseburia intestinalis M50/1]|nr:hypothetical protein ROI_23960 [Roseburia intestinalis M50/1]
MICALTADIRSRHRSWITNSCLIEKEEQI